jgi:2-succinyl-6-hydroxy-2,4-cyclohexadiene-1-carboxylate synthase
MDGLPVRTFPGRAPGVVALHGFTQHGGMFEELAALVEMRLVAPDMPGHGAAADVPASFLSTVDAVAPLVRRRPLLGYSQGGRIALGVALLYPDAVSHLVLISSGIGIADPEERAARRRSDRALADRIEREGLQTFLTWWLAQFEGLRRRGATWVAEDLSMRLQNTAEGLATALREAGQGVQPYFGSRLEELEIPVLYLAGGNDPAYLTIGREVAARAVRGRLAIIEGAGHSLVGEAPRRVAAEIERFLSRQQQE